MAKKAAKKKPAAKPAAKKKTTEKPAAAKPAASKPTLDDGVIGHAAGAVWVALLEGGPMTIAAVKKEVDAPSELTLMAIGWLAREGKLDFVTKGRSLKVSLR